QMEVSLDPARLSDDDAVWLFWANSASEEEDFVAVPLVDLGDAGQQPIAGGPTGRYAFWAGDQGIKVSLLTADSLEDRMSAEDARAIRQRGNSVPGLGHVFQES